MQRERLGGRGDHGDAGMNVGLLAEAERAQHQDLAVGLAEDLEPGVGQGAGDDADLHPDRFVLHDRGQVLGLLEGESAVSRHLKVLERAGLIERDVDEQRRPARLKAENMASAVDWLTEFKVFWGASFDQLDDLLINMKQADAKDTGHE